MRDIFNVIIIEIYVTLLTQNLIYFVQYMSST